MDVQADLEFSTVDSQDGQIGVITLNRPKALNALNYQMIVELKQQLLQWATDDAIVAVLIQSNNQKAFCAGGDIRQIYQRDLDGENTNSTFFTDEYQLNYIIHQYPKPYIALLDGIVMGGGVGISLHGSHPIGTENVRFAMPETTIGFFPDIGGTHILAHARGEIGTYLALSGDTIGIADAFYSGVLQHHIAQQHLPAFLEALTTTPLRDNPQQAVDRLIAEFATTTDNAPLAEKQALIDACFAFDNVEAIFAQLLSHQDAWSQETLKILQRKSPTSLKISLQHIRSVKKMNFAACLQQDFRIVNRCLQSHDFFEGVRALLIDKDQQPAWNPADLEHVTPSIVDAYFEPLPEGELELPDFGG